jgi:hypothetical protein
MCTVMIDDDDGDAVLVYHTVWFAERLFLKAAARVF